MATSRSLRAAAFSAAARWIARCSCDPTDQQAQRSSATHSCPPGPTSVTCSSRRPLCRPYECDGFVTPPALQALCEFDRPNLNHLLLSYNYPIL
eukprot:1921525-Pyramimonas_sp.AAC.1